MKGTPASARYALLIALAVDNVGSGLFLPLTLVYSTTVLGLDVAAAGGALAIGTACGLAVPALIGRVVDRVGPRPVVVVSLGVQAAGMACYLLPGGLMAAVGAAMLVAAGTQMFYSSVFSLIADVYPTGPKDRPFALASMIRAGAFGTGALGAGVMLSTITGDVLRWVVLVNGVSLLLAAAVIAALVTVSRDRDDAAPRDRASGRGVLRDRGFMTLIAATALVGVAGDFFLIGFPLYADAELDLPPWVTGVAFAVVTATTGLGATMAVRATMQLRRTTTTAIGAGLITVWCVSLIVAPEIPPHSRVAWVMSGIVVLAVGSLLCDSRAGAMAEAAAPPARRGAYLAAFQYSFTSAQLLAPILAGLFAVTYWLPWAVVVAALLLGIAALSRLNIMLPEHAIRAVSQPADSTRAPS